MAVLFGATAAPLQTTAATTADLPSIETDPLGAFTLGELLREDPLGDECIAEEDIDLAFFASGKGMRLPRTCLPDPCNEALTPFRLAELIGRPAQPEEWDRYFSRYADTCRKEIVDFADATQASEPPSKAAFWAPVLGGRVEQGAVVLSQPLFSRAARILGASSGSGSGGTLGAGTSDTGGSGGSGTSGSGTSGTGGSGSGGSGDGGGDDGTPITPLVDPPEDGSPTGTSPGPDGDWPEGQSPSPVPLPLGAWMLLTALAGLAALRRRRA
ncbi:VPLPA-CTERM sorting domain-containing protein [Roseobacter sinensis]|nr:VPLPA-CTERM sorting domain-containing protein [Roseobacter sp. WL0113]